MDKSTLGGVCPCHRGIAVGLYLDGGKVGQLLQPSAVLIVFGGTLAAVMVQFPFSVIKQATQQLKEVFIGIEDPGARLTEELMCYAVGARRNGLMSLDGELESIENPFLKKALGAGLVEAEPVFARRRKSFRSPAGEKTGYLWLL